MSVKAPSDFDKAIGANIRAIRLTKGMSQESLALKIGVTFQQVQKYEKGSNRISVGRLKEIADAFELDFDGLVEGAEDAFANRNQMRDNLDFLRSPGAVELMSAWMRSSPSVRKRVLGLLKSVSKAV